MRLRDLAFVFAGSVAVAVALTWPTVLRLDEFVLGSPDADTMKHLWTLWWIRHSVVHEHGLPFSTELLNYPVGLDLWPIEPLNGLAAVAAPGLSVVTVSNLAAMVNLALTGVTAALLVHELTRSRLAAVLAGLLLEGSSYAAFVIHVGVGELQHLWLLPLGFWMLLRTTRTSSWRWALGLGGVVIFTVLASFYHGIFLATGLVVLGVDQIVASTHWRRTLALLALAAGTAVIVTVPLTRVFAGSYGIDPDERGDLHSGLNGAWTSTEVEDRTARLEPEQLFFGRLDWSAPDASQVRAYGGGRLLGFPLLGLVLVALWREPRRTLPWVAVAMVGIVLAMGSFASSGGRDLQPFGRAIVLPFAWLNFLLRVVAEPIHIHVRFLALTSTAIAVIAGLAVASGLQGKRRLWSVLVVVLVLANLADVRLRQIVPWPMETFALPDFAALEFLAEDESRAGVLDLTAVWAREADSRRRVMAAQMVHGRPIQEVPIERVEYFAPDGLRLAHSLRFLRDAYTTDQEEVPVSVLNYRADFLTLQEAGFSWLLVTSPDEGWQLSGATLQALTRTFGRPTIDADRILLFSLPRLDCSPAEAALLRQQHADRLRQNHHPPVP